jgi:hypothetical protein
MTSTELPGQGVVFWPVGTGDSTTVVVSERHVLQVDLRDMVAADESGAKVAAVIDRLAETLPKTPDGKPYLAVFALTHADKDHCLGFGDLLDSEIVIGELWATPRLWREFAGDEQEMCPDAVRFHEEAERRVAATLQTVDDGAEPASGDRVRIIGYDFDAEDFSYSGLPEEYLTIPGQLVTTMDGEDVGDRFEAFIHAPFKDDCAEARNDTSLAMQITLRDPGTNTEGYLLLFGDLAYVTIKKIFDYSSPRRPERLRWDVMLSAHHCSKKVMYPPGDNGEEALKRDILDDFEKYAQDGAYVVASSLPFPAFDKPGANPPHIKARDRYEETAPSGVLCTGEYPDAEAPRPIVFGLVEYDGLRLFEVAAVTEAKSASVGRRSSGGALLGALGVTVAVGAATGMTSRRRGLDSVEEAVKQARGADAAPAAAVGFGR